MTQSPLKRMSRLFYALLLTISVSATIANANPSIDGQWSSVIRWDPHIPSSIANLPDGRLLSWNAAREETVTGAEIDRGQTLAAIYDPETGNFQIVNSQLHGMFCAGISLFEDGSVLVSGGVPNTAEASLFDIKSMQWTEMPNMNRIRYYPSATTLPNNKAFLSYALGAGNTSEVFNPESKVWSLTLNASQQVSVDEANQVARSRFPGSIASNIQWYSQLSVAPNGKVLHAGPTPSWHYFDPMGGDNNTALGKPAGERARVYANLINYGIGKVMLVGGHDPRQAQAVSAANVFLVDTNGATPVVQQGTPMRFARTYANSVVLPNGEVMVIGGEVTGQNYRGDTAQYTPEIYNPDTNQWRNAANIAVPRVYHSVAILMKDGRVLSAGGGVCGTNCITPISNQRNGQIYSPAYLFNGDGSARARPQIEVAPAQVLAAEKIVVEATPNVQKFNLVRLSGTTHHTNLDQRFLPLTISSSSGGTYEIALPANPNVLLPGYYWMFAIDANGTPSEGRTIQVIREPTDVQHIAIQNPSFEAQNLPASGFTRSDIAGWTNIGRLVGVWHPAGNPLAGSTPTNAYLDTAGTISQTLNANLHAGVSLSLSFKVASSGFDSNGDSAWEVRLYAGNQIIGKAGNHQFDPPGNQFIPAYINLTEAQLEGYSAQFGEALRIELYNSGGANSVYFDDFSLQSSKLTVRKENIALGKVTQQSSIAHGGESSRGVDGVRDGVWRHNSVTHTADEQSPWWEVDLGGLYDLDSVRLFNRTDCCSERLSNFTVLTSKQAFSSVHLATLKNDPNVKHVNYAGIAGQETSVLLGHQGRYLRVQLTGRNPLSLAEVEVLGVPVAEPLDTDDDGVDDEHDAFPEDPQEQYDSDGDGVGDNGDAFPNDATESKDSDLDGIGDNADPYPLDPNNASARVLIQPVGIEQTAGDVLEGFSAQYLIDSEGFGTPATLTNYTTLRHVVGNDWVTATVAFPNYFDGVNPNPQFVLRLGQLAEIQSMVVWGYRGITNEATNFLVEFSRDGGQSYFVQENVETSALLGSAILKI